MDTKKIIIILGLAILSITQYGNAQVLDSQGCASAGQEGDVYGKSCCAGLISVPINVEPINGACFAEYPPYGTQFLCIKYGDGVCGAGENKCNSPQDCLAAGQASNVECTTRLGCEQIVCSCLQGTICNCPINECINGKCMQCVSGDCKQGVPVQTIRRLVDTTTLCQSNLDCPVIVCSCVQGSDCKCPVNKCVDGKCIQVASLQQLPAVCDTPVCKNDPQNKMCVNCGNNICDTGENICSCPEDCQKSPLSYICGNGICEKGEEILAMCTTRYCREDEPNCPSCQMICEQDCSGQKLPVETTISMVPGGGNDGTKIIAELSNGKNADIKIMPEVASGIAIEKLGLKVCDEANNCSIQLKEVGNGEDVRPVYEVQAEREYKVLWIFKIKSIVKAEINAQSGEIISSKKPWWSFLAW